MALGRLRRVAATVGAGWLFGAIAYGQEHVYLTGVPDYQWHSACFGTAAGNLIGYWDRHGLPDLYRGPTAGGVAPLNSFGANSGIYSLWASKAGQDGRSASQPGHDDDYYVAYESVADDPCVTLHRKEHAPDCIGDFIGMNQKKWQNMNGECDGNIDGFTFVYWDTTGNRRVNFTPTTAAGSPPRDAQSGLRAFSHYSGYEVDVFTQLTEFTPGVLPGKGFTFADLKAEIDAGYPVLLFMQDSRVKFRSLPGMPRANPLIHTMLAYGYLVEWDGTPYVRFRTSWASGDNQFNAWTGDVWMPGALNIPLRGLIGFHPRPKIVSYGHANGVTTLRWQGPSSELLDVVAGTSTRVHRYVVEKASTLDFANPTTVGAPSPEQALSFPDDRAGTAFYRVTLLPPVPGGG